METTVKYSNILTLESTVSDFRKKLKFDSDFQQRCKALRGLKGDGAAWTQRTDFAMGILLQSVNNSTWTKLSNASVQNFCNFLNRQSPKKPQSDSNTSADEPNKSVEIGNDAEDDVIVSDTQDVMNNTPEDEDANLNAPAAAGTDAEGSDTNPELSSKNSGKLAWECRETFSKGTTNGTVMIRREIEALYELTGKKDPSLRELKDAFSKNSETCQSLSKQLEDARKQNNPAELEKAENAWKNSDICPNLALSAAGLIAFSETLDRLVAPSYKDLVIDLIENGDARQIIFTGAPGTGKTYVAKQVAQHFAAMGRAAILPSEREGVPGTPYMQVQFHPSYDYTDFVEGLRPIELSPASVKDETENHGKTDPNDQQKPDGMFFAKVDGSFKSFCRYAAEQNEIIAKANCVGKLEKLAEDLSSPETTPPVTEIHATLSSLREYLHGDAIPMLDAICLKLDSTYHILPLVQDMNNFLALETWADLSNNANDAKSLIRTRLTEIEKRVTAVTKLLPNHTDLKALVNAIGTLQKNDHVILAFLKARMCVDILEKGLSQTTQEALSGLKLTFFGGKISDEAIINIRNAFSKAQKPDPQAEKTELELWTDCIKLCEEHLKLKALRSTLRSLEKLHIPEDIQQLKNLLKENSNMLYPFYFFIIDEINRANLSKVFGELMYGLEKDKRGALMQKENTPRETIQTQYHNLPTYRKVRTETGTEYARLDEKADIFADGFFIPENVVVIGTMNDIDRSVDSMDFALRRRFEWLEFEVTEDSLIQAFMAKSYGDWINTYASTLAAHIMELNKLIEGAGAKKHRLSRHYFISQGQFANLPKKFETKPLSQGNYDLTVPILDHVWTYRLNSLLQEYLRGASSKDIDDFLTEAKSALRKAL